MAHFRTGFYFGILLICASQTFATTSQRETACSVNGVGCRATQSASLLQSSLFKHEKTLTNNEKFRISERKEVSSIASQQLTRHSRITGVELLGTKLYPVGYEVNPDPATCADSNGTSNWNSTCLESAGYCTSTGIDWGATNQTNAQACPLTCGQCGTQIGGISAVKFARKSDGSACKPGKESCKVYCLGDNGMGQLYSLSLDIQDGKLDSDDITWNETVIRLVSMHDQQNSRDYHDMEGLVVSRNDDSTVIVSLEGYSDGKLSDIQRFSLDTGASEGVSTFQVPAFITDHEKSNQGFEALGRTPSGQKIVTGTEHSLTVDSARVHRLLQFDASGGQPTKQIKYLTEPKPGVPDEGCGLVELEALDDAGLDGGHLLILERSWSASVGNTIYLFAADTHAADDISDCPALRLDVTNNCSDAVAVDKHLIFKWNSTGLMSADGKTYPVAVDNYEAMTLVPGPGNMLLLVNDDNKSPSQIGTQFVLLRLKMPTPIGMPTPTGIPCQPPSISSSSSSSSSR